MSNVLSFFPTTDSGKVDFFNNLYVVSTIILLIATALALFASKMTIDYSKRLSKVQDQHSKDQDLQINQLLKQIADAQEAAAILNDNAKKTTERTAKLEQRTSEAEAQAKRSEAEIAKANAAAHEADARAANSQSEVAKANAESQKASAEVAVAQVQVAVAQKSAAQANQIAEAEKLARLKLEARLAPRTLPKEMQQQLTKVLANYPQTSADIYVFEDTTDCRTLSGMLFDCLTSAGWVVHIGYVANTGEVVTGVVIGIQPGSDVETTNAGNELASELHSSGIAAGLFNYDKMPFAGGLFNSTIDRPSQIRIFVGSKP